MPPGRWVFNVWLKARLVTNTEGSFAKALDYFQNVPGDKKQSTFSTTSILTLNSMAAFKAFSASLLTCTASVWAIAALSRAFCACRRRWPDSFLAWVAVSMAFVKFMFAFSRNSCASDTSSSKIPLILPISSNFKELLRYKFWNSSPSLDSIVSLSAVTTLSWLRDSLICLAAR